MKTYKLDDYLLNWLTDRTNRSNAQTQFLFQLVDGDFNKLKDLEVKIKNCHVSYCPGDKDEVNNVLAMVENHKWFTL